MPTISYFYGVYIKMYFKPKEHNPPHFHALYKKFMSEIDIQTLDELVGDLPEEALTFVKKWASLYQDQLMDMWNRQEVRKLPPLERKKG